MEQLNGIACLIVIALGFVIALPIFIIIDALR